MAPLPGSRRTPFPVPTFPVPPPLLTIKSAIVTDQSDSSTGAAGPRSQFFESRLFRYSLPFLAVAAATVLRLLLDPGLVWKAPFIIFVFAVLISARLGGSWPGIIAVALSSVAGIAFLSHKRFLDALSGPSDFINLTTGALVLIALSIICGQLRDSLARSVREQERFRLISDNVPNFIWTAGPDGALDFVNARLTEYTGAPASALLGNGWTAFIHPDDLPGVVAYWQEILAAGSTGNREFRVRRHDGCYRWFHVRTMASRDADSGAMKWFGVSTDIQEERDLREAARSHAERFAQVVAAAPGVVGSLVLRPDGSLAMPFATPALRDIWGLEPADLVNDASPIYERLHPEDRPHAVNRMMESAKHLTMWRGEFRVMHPEKGIVWVGGQAAPARQPDGSTVWHCFISDVTKKRLAYEALRNRTSQELRILQTLVEGAPLGMVMLDRRMRHLQVSQLWLDDIGMSREDFLSKSHFECYPNLPASWIDALHRGLAGETVVGKDQSRIMPDGTEHWFNWQVSPWGDAGEATGGILIYSEDITSRKQAESAARRRDLEYRALFENMNLGLSYCRMIQEDNKPADYVYLAVNSAFHNILPLGLKSGDRMSDVRLRDASRFPSSLLAMFGRVSSTGVPEKLEVQFEGSGQWVAVSAYSPEKNHFVAIWEDITKRKWSEAAALQWQRAFEQSATPIAFVDAATDTIGAANQAYALKLGYTPEEMAGLPIRKIYGEAGEAERDAAVAKADSDAGHVVFESRHVRKDGTVIPVQVDVTAVRDEQGKLISRVGIMQDLTERRRAEQDVRFQHRLTALITEQSTDCIMLSTADKKVLLVNKAAERVFGFTQEEFRSRSPHELMHHHYPDGRPYPDSECPISKFMLQGGIMRECEDVFFHKDGTPIDVSVSGVSLELDGVRVGNVFTFRDITERKRVERILRQSDERFRRMFDADIIGFVVVEGDRITEINDYLLRLLGFSREEFFATVTSWKSLTLPELVEDCERSLAPLFRDGYAPAFEKTYVRKDGTRLPVLFAAVLLGHPSEGRLMGYVIDLTERKNLEVQVRQAQKLESIGQLAGGVAHDFNNLLTVILGYSRLAADRLGQEPSDTASGLQAPLAQISAAAERAAGLTRQLLAFSRLNVGQPRTVSLNDLVIGMEVMLQPLIGDRIEVIVSPAADAGFIHADPVLIEQVILNLAVNAHDAMPDGGTLCMETQSKLIADDFAAQVFSVPRGNYVSLTVTDTGTGMTPEVQARLFEPFFTTKEPGKGTGLGLSTVYGIVKQSGGAIGVHSAPGIGTSVRILFPAAAGTPVADEPPSAVAPASGTETVLLVEDESGVRHYMCEVLSEHGYRVLDAANGPDALGLAGHFAGTIHLLITDVALPGMNGPEIASRFLALRPGTPVLRVSGYPESFGARMEGSSASLQKPFRPEDLLRRVREVLDAAALAGPAE